VPTRELAVQVANEISDFGSYAKLGVAAIYGGQPIPKQIEKLKQNPAVLVGTPGRVMDMQGRGLLPYDHVRFAVLDEVDRMLDIGFRDDIRKILTALRKGPQTIFVSATISPEIEKLARSYMKDPAKIVSVQKSLTVERVNQSYLPVEPWDKRRLLLHLLTHEKPGLTVVFCRMKRTVDEVAKYLQDKKIDVLAMHGDMFQAKREKVMGKLREGDLKVLVASDLASRGLDVEDITHVVNYDLPEDPEAYIHRIGRTARAGRDGVAWSFVCPDQGDLLSAIEQLANVEIPRKEYPDFTPGQVPVEVQQRREAEARKKEDLAKQRSRHEMVLPDPVAAKDSAKAAEMFPGGLVPVALPEKRLGGRLRSGRSR